MVGVGATVGAAVGELVGAKVVGAYDGGLVGAFVGARVGCWVGLVVGLTVGARVGVTVSCLAFPVQIFQCPKLIPGSSFQTTELSSGVSLAQKLRAVRFVGFCRKQRGGGEHGFGHVLMV